MTLSRRLSLIFRSQLLRWRSLEGIKQEGTSKSELKETRGVFESATEGIDRSYFDNQDPLLVTFYANLEIPYGSDIETTKKAYRRLMKQYHPDMHSEDPEKRRIANHLAQGLTDAYKGIERALTNGL